MKGCGGFHTIFHELRFQLLEQVLLLRIPPFTKLTPLQAVFRKCIRICFIQSIEFLFQSCDLAREMEQDSQMGAAETPRNCEALGAVEEGG
jgi:hypothetical protein